MSFAPTTAFASTEAPMKASGVASATLKMSLARA